MALASRVLAFDGKMSYTSRAHGLAHGASMLVLAWGSHAGLAKRPCIQVMSVQELILYVPEVRHATQ
jgi:hypothetical protein